MQLFRTQCGGKQEINKCDCSETVNVCFLIEHWSGHYSGGETLDLNIARKSEAQPDNQTGGCYFFFKLQSHQERVELQLSTFYLMD